MWRRIYLLLLMTSLSAEACGLAHRFPRAPTFFPPPYRVEKCRHERLTASPAKESRKLNSQAHGLDREGDEFFLRFDIVVVATERKLGS